MGMAKDFQCQFYRVHFHDYRYGSGIIITLYALNTEEAQELAQRNLGRVRKEIVIDHVQVLGNSGVWLAIDLRL